MTARMRSGTQTTTTRKEETVACVAAFACTRSEELRSRPEFMSPPPELAQAGMVMLLLRAVYGLVDAPLRWATTSWGSCWKTDDAGMCSGQ